MDLTWLREQCLHILEKNRVKEIRRWNGTVQECVYHAPILTLEVKYPSNLPFWLKGIWRFWWSISLPWRPNYPHQWFWDSCAHAIVLSHLNIDLARKEIESLLYTQREDGFIPHMVWNSQKMHWVDRMLRWLYRGKHTSPYLQPPALAEAVEHLWEHSGDLGFLQRVLPRLEKYYLYLHKERNPSGDGLLEIIVSYESGKDRSPEYDIIYGEPNTKSILRGPMLKVMVSEGIKKFDLPKIFASNKFRVKDLLFNCIYAQNLFALARLCQVVGKRTEAQLFQRKAEMVEECILNKMYDEEKGLFFSLDARYGRDKPIPVNTVSSLMPLILDTISQSQAERLVQDHLLNPMEYWTNYPVPVEPLSSVREDKESHIIWRGLQTWVYTNWYIVRGLGKQAQRFPAHRQRYTQIADELTQRTYQLIEKEGFCDFYHSQTGKGSIAKDFSWSTLILDMAYHMKTAEKVI